MVITRSIRHQVSFMSHPKDEERLVEEDGGAWQVPPAPFHQIHPFSVEPDYANKFR